MYKRFTGSIVFALCALGWGSSGFAQEVPTPRGELRIVDRHPLNWASIAFNVFEHLVEIDRDGKLIPGLATSWRWVDDRTLEVKLRQGVKFHNSEILDAEIVKLNWEENFRLKQPHLAGRATAMGSRPDSRPRWPQLPIAWAL